MSKLNTENEFNLDERRFLLENTCHDLCLNRDKVDCHNDKRGYIYVSDILKMYKKYILNDSKKI